MSSRNDFRPIVFLAPPTPLANVGALGIGLLFSVACTEKPAQQPPPETPETVVQTPVSANENQNQNQNSPEPWALPAPPPTSVYDGKLFELSHNYPTTPVPPPANPPWQAAIGGGLINTKNAAAYAQALKDYVKDDMQVLAFDYANWDAGKRGWFNVPWLSTVREPIRGSYVGSSDFPPEMFPKSGLTVDMATHVLVYYDDVAASSLQNVWGATGMNPVPGMASGGAQFAEGSIIVKPALTTADGAQWPPIEGASPWEIYAPVAQNNGGEGGGPPVLQTINLFQFDIIVKDSKSSPQSQWVFTTLVYDKNAPGSDWDKLVVLGAMWGNDPQVMSPQGCDYLKPNGCPPLAETWINPKAPLYSKETLGWGGRLSGPNDAAVALSPNVVDETGKVTAYDGRYAMSSCMSCHGSAEYQMESFLLPGPSTCTGDGCQFSGNFYETGTPEYLRWFQNRPGTQPMDGGTIALDYEMNYAFKALPAWFQATQQTGNAGFAAEALSNRRIPNMKAKQ